MAIEFPIEGRRPRLLVGMGRDAYYSWGIGSKGHLRKYRFTQEFLMGTAGLQGFRCGVFAGRVGRSEVVHKFHVYYRETDRGIEALHVSSACGSIYALRHDVTLLFDAIPNPLSASLAEGPRCKRCLKGD